MVILPGKLFTLITAAVLFLPVAGEASTVWKLAPSPKFPQQALKRGSEGYVVIRAYIMADGTVTRASVSHSSGDSTLDEAARAAVLKWKMYLAAIKPPYLTKGYDQRIDFRQEAPAIAQYRDRIVYFESFESSKIWISAPSPEYPYEARRSRIEGTAYVKVQIGPDGKVDSAELAKSSGNTHLDYAALSAVRWWRARKQYAGVKAIFPVRFTLQRPF